MSKTKAPTVKSQYNGIPTSIVTRDIPKYVEPTGNIYQSLNVISRYANQVGVALKNEINEKLAEFSHGPDNLEEIHENREQIEISKIYERQPKPTLIALEDFKEGRVYFRNASDDVVE